MHYPAVGFFARLSWWSVRQPQRVGYRVPFKPTCIGSTLLVVLSLLIWAAWSRGAQADELLDKAWAAMKEDEQEADRICSEARILHPEVSEVQAIAREAEAQRRKLERTLAQSEALKDAVANGVSAMGQNYWLSGEGRVNRAKQMALFELSTQQSGVLQALIATCLWPAQDRNDPAGKAARDILHRRLMAEMRQEWQVNEAGRRAAMDHLLGVAAGNDR